MPLFLSTAFTPIKLRIMDKKHRKHHVKIHVHKRETEAGLVYEVREIFIGLKTLIALLGFSVGSVLVGRSLWEYGNDLVGLLGTIVVGVAIFALSGMMLKKFHF